MRKMIGFGIILLFAVATSACANQNGAPDSGEQAAPAAASEDIDHSRAALPASGNVIAPSQLTYAGAFRLPGSWEPPQTFAYGGNAMTFRPDGDAGNTDNFPGSLFVMGHDTIAYGDLPDGNQVAEISIPNPTMTKNLEEMNTAEFLQPFEDVTAGFFGQLEEIPKAGMAYLDHPATGPKIHITWGQHLQPPDTASHGWFDPDLKNPNMAGSWFLGDQNLYSVNGYMFTIPMAWADAYTGGKPLASGRMRDGGQGGMGPTLFAYRPWNADGSPPPDGTRLEETTLLLYENAYASMEIERAMDGYQHPDEWEGSAWLEDSAGKAALVFAGTKANGSRFWYGYMHPDGPDKVCVDQHVADFKTCRMADGSVCAAAETQGCCEEDQESCVSMRGWWSNRFDAELIFYDPADLAAVAGGAMESWEPQPYAVLDIDEHLLLSAPEWDKAMLGWGDQRRYRIGAAAFDRGSGLLYLLELFADEGKPVVHVWRLE